MSVSAKSNPEPARTVYFVLIGIVFGLIGGLIGGLSSLFISARMEVLWVIGPERSTGRDVAVFIYDIGFMPLVMAFVFGLLLPLAYRHAKIKRRRYLSRRAFLLWVLGGLLALQFYAFAGMPHWPVLIMAHSFNVLVFGAGLTFLLVNLYQRELEKLPEESPLPSIAGVPDATRLPSASTSLDARLSALAGELDEAQKALKKRQLTNDERRSS
jgi:MFS family permease